MGYSELAGGTVKKSYRIILNTYTTAGSLSAINKWFVRFVWQFWATQSFKKERCYFWIGQAKIFWATCLTQDSNQNGQDQFWLQFQKASLKTQKSTAIFLYVVKPIDDRGNG